MVDNDDLPNLRDGLNKKQRIVLHCIATVQREFGDRNVPTSMLYGRVIEYTDMSVDEMQLILQQLLNIKH